MTRRQLTILIALISGLPSASWAVSLAFSWITTGSPLATSPGAYALLLIVTFPMGELFNHMAGRVGNVHMAAVLYTALCSLAYAAASTVILAPVLVSSKAKADQ